jgi:ribosomal protein L14
MIQVQTKLKVADNSGAKIVSIACIGAIKALCHVGEIITGAVKVHPYGSKEGDVVKAVIVRTQESASDGAVV